VGRWRNRTYRSDPTRRARFSLGHLRVLYYQWRKGGCVPSANLHRWVVPAPSVDPRVVVRFIKFCTLEIFPSYKAAWDAFLSRPGHRSEERIRYKLMLRVFSRPNFCALQRDLMAERDAHTRLNRLHLEITTAVGRRFAYRPRRRRTATDLAMESAAL
jgi:hypothetical protein